MSNTNSIESSEIDITQNVYKLETDYEKHEKFTNNKIKTTKNNDNLNKTDKVIVPIDDYNKDGDKINTNGAKKDFVVYGYYVREPIWVHMATEDRDSGGGGGVGYDPSTRNPFIRLVFLIVFIMLLLTAGFGAACLLVEGIGLIFAGRMGLFILLAASGLMLGLSYGMACVRCCRSLPCNVICLALSVIGMSAIVGYMVVKFNTALVIFAVIATAAVVFVCCLLALTSFDFTKWILYLVVISVVVTVLFLCVLIATLVTGESYPILTLIILVVATLINAVMLTIQIQMVIGGKSVELEEDDYAYGAFMIYTGVVDLFIQLLQILGIADWL